MTTKGKPDIHVSAHPAARATGAVTNAEVAAIFEEIADVLAIAAANPFRIRAYRNAARYIAAMPGEIAEYARSGRDLTALPGIGEDLAEKIQEIVATGRSRTLDRLHREVPVSLTELLEIPALGPKRVRLLHEALGIDTRDDLRRALAQGRLAGLPGLGPKTVEKIRTALAEGTVARRLRRDIAAAYARPLEAALAAVPGVVTVVTAGSFRRGRETVGDLDLLVCAADGSGVRAALARHPGVEKMLSSGSTRSSLRLANGLQVDVRVVAPASFGAALVYFTGSKAHNIALRRIAQARGLKVNEYGVFPLGGRKAIAGDTEASVYAALGLPLIPPELREDRGELLSAQRGELPELVTLADLRGDLHCHTRASDGRADLRAMARAARVRGLDYLAITEHSARLRIAHGLDEAALRAQMQEIERLNAAFEGLVLLKGIEVDIRDDGTLDLPDAILNACDVVVAAVHSAFDLPSARQTERLLRALRNPVVDILAHPSGRLIDGRAPYAFDLARVLHAARDHGVALELNAQPERLDLGDAACRAAHDAGVRIALSADAHAEQHFDYLAYGITQARRGWLEAKDVLNTRRLPALRRLLARGN